ADGLGGGLLRRAPRIKDGHLVDARYRAVRRATLLGQILAADVRDRILFQRNARIATLLRAVVHQPILADIQITRPSATAPLVWTSERDVVLKCIHPSEAAFFQRLHLVINATFFFAQGLQLAFAVVNDADRRAESKLQCALANGQRVLRITHAAADYGIDVHVKLGVLG